MMSEHDKNEAKAPDQTPTPAIVTRFSNGMVAVFDSRGKQIPSLQGTWKEMKDAIEAAMKKDSVVEFR